MSTIPVDTDEEFFKRADAIIDVANEQLSGATRGKVSASCMYATARFNAWVSACGVDSGEELQAARQEAIDYFTGQYRTMLEENLDEYIRNFVKYMRPKEA